MKCLVSLILLFALIGCLDVDYIYVIDTDHGVCSKRKVINKSTMQSRFVEDLDISECDGNFSITPADYVRLFPKAKK